MKRYAVREPEDIRPLKKNGKVRIYKKGAVVHVEQAVRHAPEDRKARRA